jgi:hypothetical protein
MSLLFLGDSWDAPLRTAGGRSSRVFYGQAVAGGANPLLTATDGTGFFATAGPKGQFRFKLAISVGRIVNPAVGGASFDIDVTAHQGAGNLVLDAFVYSNILFGGADPGLAASDVLRTVSGSGLVLTGVASATVSVQYKAELYAITYVSS